MATTITVAQQLSDYDIYPDTTLTGIVLTQKDAAIVASLFVLSTDRNVWEPISDTDWDNLSSRIAIILAEFGA